MGTKIDVFKNMNPLLHKIQKKVKDPNGPYISTGQTKIRNVCMSVILEFCLLLSLVRPEPTQAYVGTWNIA